MEAMVKNNAVYWPSWLPDMSKPLLNLRVNIPSFPNIPMFAVEIIVCFP